MDKMAMMLAKDPQVPSRSDHGRHEGVEKMKKAHDEAEMMADDPSSRCMTMLAKEIEKPNPRP